MEIPRQTLEVICQEVQLHLDYCRQWGISEQEIFATQESAACIAYTRYLLDCGMTGSLARALCSCNPLCFGLRSSCSLHYSANYPQLTEQSLSNVD